MSAGRIDQSCGVSVSRTIAICLDSFSKSTGCRGRDVHNLPRGRELWIRDEGELRLLRQVPGFDYTENTQGEPPGGEGLTGGVQKASSVKNDYKERLVGSKNEGKGLNDWKMWVLE